MMQPSNESVKRRSRPLMLVAGALGFPPAG
jgi:hypothetical protein